jgi:hypothetical protein
MFQTDVKKLEKFLLPNVILHMVHKGYLNFLKDLKNENKSIVDTDLDERNALHLACAGGNLEIVMFLLENGLFFTKN